MKSGERCDMVAVQIEAHASRWIDQPKNTHQPPLIGADVDSPPFYRVTRIEIGPRRPVLYMAHRDPTNVLRKGVQEFGLRMSANATARLGRYAARYLCAGPPRVPPERGGFDAYKHNCHHFALWMCGGRAVEMSLSKANQTVARLLESPSPAMKPRISSSQPEHVVITDGEQPLHSMVRLSDQDGAEHYMHVLACGGVLGVTPAKSGVKRLIDDVASLVGAHAADCSVVSVPPTETFVGSLPVVDSSGVIMP